MARETEKGAASVCPIHCGRICHATIKLGGPGYEESSSDSVDCTVVKQNRDR